MTGERRGRASIPPRVQWSPAYSGGLQALVLCMGGILQCPAQWEQSCVCAWICVVCEYMGGLNKHVTLKMYVECLSWLHATYEGMFNVNTNKLPYNLKHNVYILWQKAHCKLPALLNWVREHSQKGLHQKLHQPLQYLRWVSRAPPYRLPLQAIQSSLSSCAVVIWETVHITLKFLWVGGWRLDSSKLAVYLIDGVNEVSTRLEASNSLITAFTSSSKRWMWK